MVSFIALKFLPNSLKIIPHASQGIGHLLIFSILELSLQLTLATPFSKHLLGHCLTVETMFSWAPHTSPLILPHLHYWLFNTSTYLLNIVFSRVPPTIIFSLRNLTQYFYVAISRSVSSHQATLWNIWIQCLQIPTSHPYTVTSDLPAQNGLHYPHLPPSQTSSSSVIPP